MNFNTICLKSLSLNLNCKFNHLINFRTLSIMRLYMWSFFVYVVDIVKSGFEVKFACYDIIINYYLSQKPKLIENDKFNYLSNILVLLCPHVLTHTSHP